jgi:hypothetical protein
LGPQVGGRVPGNGGRRRPGRLAAAALGLAALRPGREGAVGLGGWEAVLELLDGTGPAARARVGGRSGAGT